MVLTIKRDININGAFTYFHLIIMNMKQYVSLSVIKDFCASPREYLSFNLKVILPYNRSAH